MTQVTRVPSGLQDFLGTQAQGRNPSELAQTIVPIVDFGQFVGFRNEKWWLDGYTPFAGASASETASTIVPEGELWVLKTAAIRNSQSVVGAVGDGYTFSAIMSNNSNASSPLNSHSLCDPYVYRTINAGSDAVYVGRPIDNVIAPPGSQISLVITQIVSVGSTFNPTAALRYDRYKV